MNLNNDSFIPILYHMGPHKGYNALPKDEFLK